MADVFTSHSVGPPPGKVADGVIVGLGVTTGAEVVITGGVVLVAAGVFEGEGFDEAQPHTPLAAEMTAAALPIPHSLKTQLRAALLMLE